MEDVFERMIKGLEDKIAVITGGSTGIGRATCELLSSYRCKVYALDIEPVNDEENITYLKCDVSDYEQVEKCVAEIHKKEERIDYLFANAGIHSVGTIEDTTDDELDRIMGVNIKGTVNAVKAVLPTMKTQKEGSIVLMGSDQVFEGKPASAIYGLTKAAIAQLTKSLTLDYTEKYNIRINCVCPGTINTPLVDKAVDKFSEKSGTPESEIVENLKTAQPIQRLGKPEEVAKFVVFLFAGGDSFASGGLYSIDGGYTAGKR